ncbi:hypothetical protein Tco_0994009 [Tanacetum coccineum]
MHTSKDDYLINTLRFVSAIEETQIYGAILPDSLTSPEMKETKAYKTYIGFSSEPTRKSKRVKRPAKKTTKAPARGLVIRENLEIPVSKKKEKVDVTRGKGIELLSQVALNEDAQFEEVQKKSMRDFHKTHLSGSGAVKIIPSVTSEGTGVKPGVPDVTEEESSKIEAESWGNDKDDSNNEQDSSDEDKNKSGLEYDHEENEEDVKEVKGKLVKIPSNDSDNEDEIKITNKAEGDEDEEMYYTTSQLYNDMDIRLNKPVDTDKEFVQEEGTDAAMTNIQQGNENPKILQVIEYAYVTLSTIPQKTKVLVTSSSHLYDLAAKFLTFLDIPQTDAEVVSPMDVHVHHELKKILIDKMDKSESYLAAPKHRDCYEGLKKSYDLDKTFFSTYRKVYSLKRSQNDKDKDSSAGSDRGFKKRKTSKDAAPATDPKAKESQSGLSKGNKSQSKSSGKYV